MKKSKRKQGVVIYQAPSGAIEFRGDFSKHTIWASQAQIATKVFKDGDMVEVDAEKGIVKKLI